MNLSQTHLLLMTLSVIAISVIDAKDYYQLLGISKDATDRQIKRAFHKLATKYHPDKNKEKDAEEKFREIAQAYEILSDSEKRKQYDQFGESAFTNGGESQHFNTFNFHDFFKHFDTQFGNHQQHHFGHEDDSFGFSFGGDDFMDNFFGSDDVGDAGFGFSDFDHFGSHDSFFGSHFGGFERHSQNSRHVHQNNGHYRSTETRTRAQGGTSCRTVTQRVGNMVTTYTQCS